MTALAIGFMFAGGLIAVTVLLILGACRLASRADRLIEEADRNPPEGSLQARVDALRAMGDEVEGVEWHAPRRRRGGGWVC